MEAGYTFSSSALVATCKNQKRSNTGERAAGEMTARGNHSLEEMLGFS